MKALHELLEGIACSWNGKGELTRQIVRVQSDSRKVKGGDLFVAVTGLHADGHDFIGEAVQRGAQAVVSERLNPEVRDLGIPQFLVSDSRFVLNRLAAASYDFPADRLRMIGVTGTNGKTTTAFLIQHLLNAKSRSGLIGSVLYDDGGKQSAAGNTTPVPETLNETLAGMAANGLSYCVMEVSSHALDQNRTQGISFSSVVFTNLTQDHLDYHKDFETYFQAKRKLFLNESPPARSVINIDDAYGRRLAKELKALSCVSSYGIDSRADYTAKGIKLRLNGSEFELVKGRKRYPISTSLILRYNLYNILAALSVAANEGFSLEGLIERLSDFPGVPGRMERIREGQDFFVFVDYAHTPDGLLSALSSIRMLAEGRVISVFGCGGDRDRVKRPLMGEIASRFSDAVWLTSDNPRTEAPEAIIAEIEQGIPRNRQGKVKSCLDRREAIREAFQAAKPEDIVILFGKGHEDYQVLGTERVPFNDREIARQFLREQCLRSMKSQKLAAGKS